MRRIDAHPSADRKKPSDSASMRRAVVGAVFGAKRGLEQWTMGLSRYIRVERASLATNRPIGIPL
jgi:hypothetical protein